MTRCVSLWSHGLVILLLSLVCTTQNTHAKSIGLRGGGVYGLTELKDENGWGLSAFLRGTLNPRWQTELSSGYSRLNGTDYATDLISSEARLLYSTRAGGAWSAHFYTGLGIARFDLVTSPPVATTGAGTTGWSALLPVGIGLSFPLSTQTALEILAGYTYTLSDEINRAAIEKGNDALWSLTIGLAFGGPSRGESSNPTLPTVRFDAPTDPVQPPTANRATSSLAPSPAGADSDGDGLSDRQETLIYFTNPVMADSDGDGLNDREEVEIYATNPNRLDSDGGGMRDGDEVQRGADPLDPGDDLVPKQMLEEEATPISEATYELPVIYFPNGGLTLVAEARESLDRTVTYMRMRSEVGLELHGHSDSMGSRSINLQLSRRRAETIKAYLVEHGVSEQRLRVRAYGESRPITSNATEAGRLKNRRVELVPVR